MERFYNFADLFPVPVFVACKKFVPLVEIQTSEERMRRAICAQFSAAIGFEKIYGRFADAAERFDKLFFSTHEFRFEWDGTLEFDYSETGNPKREVKPFVQRQLGGACG